MEIERTLFRGTPARSVLHAGLAVAVIEMIPVLPIQAALGNSPLVVFQSIASGLLGRSAYTGGNATGLLGIALHIFIAVVAVAIFAAAAARWPVLLRRCVWAGLAFGLGAYLVMSYVVLPLSAVAYKPATEWPMVATSVAIHMLFFGLPAALLLRRAADVAIEAPRRATRAEEF
jgi:hypothetical protein